MMTGPASGIAFYLQYTAAAGALFSTVGTLLVFFCGTPFRVRPKPKMQVIATGIERKPSSRTVIIDKILNGLSWAGLILMLLGGGAQVYAAWP